MEHGKKKKMTIYSKYTSKDGNGRNAFVEFILFILFYFFFLNLKSYGRRTFPPPPESTESVEPYNLYSSAFSHKFCAHPLKVRR